MSQAQTKPACDGSRGLKVADLHKSFGSQTALEGVSFLVAEREILAVLGPSGCGKSTLLAIIAGLEHSEGGSVCWNGADLEGIPAYKRGFGLMFQDLALFPHQNVFDNVAFGLRMKRFSNQEAGGRVREVLKLVGLPGFEQRDTNTLSGGEAQRVALARSLAPYPHLLMLDEPLGSLDRNLRERLMVELRQILRASQQTAIYVTHDQEEAFSVADRIVLMNAGKIVQIGTPFEIYQHPATTFAARFLGLENLMPARIEERDGAIYIKTPIGVFPYRQDLRGQVPSSEVQALLRPDAVQPGEDGSQVITGVIDQISFRGSDNRVFITINNQSLSFDLRADHSLPGIGEEMKLSFDPEEAFQIFSS